MKFWIPSLALFLFACGSDKNVGIITTPPKAEITSHENGDEVLEGYVVTLTGNATHSIQDADALTATWYVGTEILCETAPPASDGITT